MEIKFQTDVGQKRKMNQDYVGVFKNQVGIVLTILADGMGGHQAGDIASRLAVNFLGSQWQENQLDEPEVITQWLIDNIQKTNEQIYEKGQMHQKYAGMGTTLVCAVLLANDMIIANIGDSRAYLIREQKITQLTEDHSLVNELVKYGEITPEMALNHPRKNVLIRSLGMPKEIETDVFYHSLTEQDYVLLCSDGLTNMVSDNQILLTLSDEQSTVETKVNQLIMAANEAGGMDNITALIVYVDALEEGSQ